MTTRFIQHTLLTIALLATVSSCGSSKQATTNTPYPATSSVAAPANYAAALDSVATANNNAKWQRLQMPVSVNLRAPKNVSISGTAIMDRDRSLLISLKYFGFEIGMLYLTSDTIMVVDKVHKSYLAEPTAQFLAGVPVTIGNVQNMLLGRMFVVGKDAISSADIRQAEIETIQGGVVVMPKNPSNRFNYGFTLNTALQLMGLVVQAGSNAPVTVAYSDFANSSIFPLPAEVNIDYTSGKTLIDASLQWNPSKAKWDGNVNLRTPDVSKGYKRISSAEIINMVSKL